jgi:hypothetical protein
MLFLRSVRTFGNHARAALGALALAALIVAPGSAAAENSWAIEILSSAPDQVSGGDALVRVHFPGAAIKQNVTLLRNGADVTASLAPQGGALEGVVAGFVLGDNLLELKSSPSASSVKAQLAVRNHPLSGPIFSGPQQQPFVCTTARVGLGQPIVDNRSWAGARTAARCGASSTCTARRGASSHRSPIPVAPCRPTWR